MEHTPEDTTFAPFCVLKDATDLRLFVRRTWYLSAGIITYISLHALAARRSAFLFMTVSI
ncbi:hypothetical protein CC78DRAFT_534815 [Lojkania enalia]|uniref:Uncharacterized protein n=1 Tax=Lojkania enalia TaxID=147567 RepID=A0A9P4K5J5_9PLEO|nr:hypothetical protein CC78DRAFT_534815 [Didymosphaeria enalia]